MLTGLPSPSFAVGGPGPTLGMGWDAAPLVLAVWLAVLMRWARLPLRVGRLLSLALLGGLALDLVDDAVGLSLATTVAVLGLGFAVVAARRPRAA